MSWGNHADGAAQAVLSHGANVLIVDADAAAVYVVETEQQPRQRGFTRTAGTDNRQGLSRRDLESNALQHRVTSLIVAIVHIMKAN